MSQEDHEGLSQSSSPGGLWAVAPPPPCGCSTHSKGKFSHENMSAIEYITLYLELPYNVEWWFATINVLWALGLGKSDIRCEWKIIFQGHFSSDNHMYHEPTNCPLIALNEDTHYPQTSPYPQPACWVNKWNVHLFIYKRTTLYFRAHHAYWNCMYMVNNQTCPASLWLFLLPNAEKYIYICHHLCQYTSSDYNLEVP